MNKGTESTGTESTQGLNRLHSLEVHYAALHQEAESKHSEVSETTMSSSPHSQIEWLQIKNLLQENLPDQAEKSYARDLLRLQRLPIFSGDYQKIHAHLEFVAELPWKNLCPHTFDSIQIKQDLDGSHFGLNDIKEQLLEYMTIAFAKPQRRAPILAFVGPSGMGKVSLGISVAKALGRPIERINLAAARGQSFISGEARSDAAVSAGALMRALHRLKVRNPVIILEELDHVDWNTSDHAGIPLLDLFDPRITHFTDEYAAIPFDISQIWFIVTAQSLDGVPRALKSHMEILEFSGYTDQEKIKIAKHFLIPRSLDEANLIETSMKLSDQSIMKMIHRYTRESGVTQLRQCIRKLTRKVARRQSTAGSSAKQSLTIEANELSLYLGPEWFFEEENRHPMQAGVATGLVWAESGGEVIYIEAVRLPKGRGLILTGRLGKIMRESAETALSYLWSRAEVLGISENNFVQVATHIHVPAGSIAKDGPSAGLTIFVALASLFLQKPIPADIAMTGEITLTGDIFPVGGIREKVLAAHRAGFKRIMLPSQNKTDLQVLPREIRDELEFIWLKNVEEAIPVVFPSLKKTKKTAPISINSPPATAKAKKNATFATGAR